MINSRYLQVHPDAIIEYIWDDTNFINDDYTIIDDIKNSESSFVFNSTTQLNKIPQQLYSIDKIVNRLGIADPTQKQFLQQREYVNNNAVLFDKIKIWLPLNYNFQQFVGLYLRVFGLNFENKVEYNFSNFYIDITNPLHLNQIENDTTFRYNEKLWGKSITLNIPSLYEQALNVTNNQPTPNTINHRLTNGVLGLSQTSPIFIDFRFLQTKNIILNETTYITTPIRIVSLPQTPEYNNLSVQIEPASDGDYFIINGLYNGTISGFNNFMSTLEQSGKQSYILYSITISEENIPQETKEIYVYKDFWKGIDDFRPVIKYSNTTASIRVDMKLINSIDNSMIMKSTEYVLLGNEVSKYGKILTGINVSNTFKPILYNSKPDMLVMPSKELLNSHLKRKGIDKIEVKFVPYPVLTNIYNIVASVSDVNINEITYKSIGNLNLQLNPFDNIITFNLATIKDNNIIPFKIDNSNSTVQLVFKSENTDLRIPLYLDSNGINFDLGILVFKIPQNNQEVLKRIKRENGKFYITLTTNGNENVIYYSEFNLNITKPEKPLSDSPILINSQNTLNFNNILNNTGINTNNIKPKDTNKLPNLTPEQIKKIK